MGRSSFARGSGSAAAGRGAVRGGSTRRGVPRRHRRGRGASGDLRDRLLRPGGHGGTATGAGCRRCCRCSWPRCCWCRWRRASARSCWLGTDGADVAAAGARRAPAAGRGRRGRPLVRGDDPSGAGGHPDRAGGVRCGRARRVVRAVAGRGGGMSPAVQGAVFAATLVGFGSKAGIVPLHAWLPRAHPEAPSHVSALMSAAMVNLGVYGIVRVGFDLLRGGSRWWWLLVLPRARCPRSTGSCRPRWHRPQTAARVLDHREHGPGADRCRRGRIVRRVRKPAAGRARDDRRAAAPGQPRGVQDAAVLLGRVGAARHRPPRPGRPRRAADGMPVTTALFGIGALAASALPPGNGFVSEWLLLQGLIHGLPARRPRPRWRCRSRSPWSR